MRITILECARKHGITEQEIRAVVSYPLLRVHITPRLPGAVPHLFIGNFDEDEPLLEIIADLADSAEWIVFHAMMLRPQTISQLHLEEFLGDGDLAQQRPQRRDNP
ncbi:hypothetical protein IU510_04365 [Nocardia cyriacigeorgica]|uniref:hypothetical protein n=1 Tax=Nocardia cyriacigeorgica TaxID=135487 RepID=UPI0018949CEE|nr:hypothetical protein [Nocardia cyriacigeorgica]MBF6097312.1 hypothetical protein [Nocardia cyriacigeorgica]MBF6160890.1 hypothetical protein [Nocardia cyriacigeorgica]MBF6201119.1 hypothetical protein [Nocardia cyriacigeorgica]MBF6318780.1 hypothetical protein [Nocardia cyriacigeorgica]MBF6344094.1 hypothetical protein [Nocardia cyriacigeorgica]